MELEASDKVVYTCEARSGASDIGDVLQLIVAVRAESRAAAREQLIERLKQVTDLSADEIESRYSIALETGEP